MMTGSTVNSEADSIGLDVIKNNDDTRAVSHAFVPRNIPYNLRNATGEPRRPS